MTFASKSESQKLLWNARRLEKLKIGQINHLEAVRRAEQGLYLESSEGDILLPRRWASPFGVGDRIRVFIHTDSEDRLLATTEMPKAMVGEFASLDVTDVAPFGAFLDWGLPKDLLCPKAQQHRALRKGDRTVVRVCLDEETGRVYATNRLMPFMEEHVDELRAGDTVNILALWPSPLGFSVLVNQRYSGLIHHKDLLSHVESGFQCQAWIKEIREDGGLGISLKAKGFDGVLEAKPRVLAALHACGGKLPLHDKSDSFLIQKHLNMSKKTFKKAVGNLMRDGLVSMSTDGIQLKERGPRA